MKILIVHGSAGAGHTKAAEAIFNGLKRRQPDDGKGVIDDIVIIDSLDYTSALFKDSYRKSYSIMVTRVPWLWGFAFALADVGFLQPLVKIIRRIYNQLNTARLREFLKREQFDWIVSTHFLANEVVGDLKTKGLIKSRVIVVVTDFDVHHIWTAPGVDYYAGACDFTKKKLISLGIPPEKILLTGIPTDKKFHFRPDKMALRRQFGLTDNKFTVLVATGSFGMGPIEQIIKALNGFQVLVVCGHNKQLFERLSQQKFDSVKVYGLVNNMNELMALSDVMVTKPGGLSISEALVSQLPMIFFNAIPGQETNNVKVLKQYDIGFSDCSISQIVGELKRLSSSPETYIAAQQNTQRLAKPQAVKDIISLIYG